MMHRFKVLLLILVQAAKEINQMPISVPPDNYPAGRFHHNAFYNRLPGDRLQMGYPIQTDPITNDNSVTDEYEDYDETTKRPAANAQYSIHNYNSNSYSPLLTENYIKHKRRRRKKIRRPCIPIQSINSNLYSNNRFKREERKESGKTFGLIGGLLGNRYPFGYPQGVYGTPFYGNYYDGGGGYPNRPHYDNVRPPQYDDDNDDKPQNSNNRPQYNRPQYDNAPLYNPVGGYPCIPVSYGHVPFGGPLGFFGQGGLFDSGVSPSIQVPQTVIINRPPLFGNRPPLFAGSGQGDETQNDGRPPGFWGSVVDKLSEFVTSVSPQAVYSALGDTLQNFGGAIQNTQPAGEATSVVDNAVDSIRNGYREFTSLLFR
ncbi:hypothetical protein ACKWTF_009629 [Chironomus riparius]